MNMPENSNMSNGADGAQAKPQPPAEQRGLNSVPPVPTNSKRPRPANGGNNFGEEAFDSKVSSIICKDSASDDAIWQNTQELLNYELEKRLVWQRIRYFVSASAAAVILLAVVVYLVLAPAGIPANWLSAMEQEHQSFIRGDVKPITGTDMAGVLSAQFRTENLLSDNECCCALLKNNKELRLEGGNSRPLCGHPCAAIYARYNATPVTFLLLEPSGGLSRSESVYGSYPSPVWTDKAGEFNVAMKRLPNCLIGVISELDKQALANLLKNIDTMKTDCDSCGCDKMK